jgi:group I intron endonuclease
MIFYVLDLSKVDTSQVRELLNSAVKSGFVGGIYLWINKTNGKTYVGSSVNLYSRISGYFCLKNLHGIIGNALLKYGLVGFVLIIVFMRESTKESVLSLEQAMLEGPNGPSLFAK